MKTQQYINPFTGEVINVFCPTGAGGGKDPTCSPDKGGGSGSSGTWSRNEAIKNPKSAAFGGRIAKAGELDTVYHQTSRRPLEKILESGEIKVIRSISKDIAEEAYGDTVDGADFVYTGLSKKASRLAAVGEGVMLEINASKLADRTIVQPDVENGIAMIHGNISVRNIRSVMLGNRLYGDKKTRDTLLKAGFSFSGSKRKWVNTRS